MTDDDKKRECMQVLAAARACLFKKAPYLSHIMYGLVPRVVSGVHTVGVTQGMVLYINPDWFLDVGNELPETLKPSERRKQTTELRSGLLAHEVMHVLRGQERIRRMPNHELANIAFDIPINHDLEKSGFSLPEGGIFPRTFDLPEGLTGEQYYDLLQKKMDQVQKFCGGAFGGGSAGEGQGEDQEGEGGGHDQRGAAAGRCGSCGGHTDNSELERQLDAEAGRAPADKQRLRKETIREIEATVALGRGTIPSSLQELLKEKPGLSIIPWKLQLSRIIRKATGRIVCGQADFSMRRPSKKSYTRGILRPGMVDRKVEVGFVEDSSGSMGMEQLLSARTEATAVFKQLGISDAWFVDADADVAVEPKRIRLSDIAVLPVHGRGGTNFIPAIEKMQTLRPKPDICIYLTDGDGVAPEHSPQGMEVVWCIVPTPNGRRPATWGHLVVVSDQQELREPYGR